MSIESTITQLYLKVEGIFREVKTGFPEGLKQYLLNQCHDVYVWIGTHHMALSALAVSTVVGLSLGAYYSFKKKLSRELDDAYKKLSELNVNLEQTKHKLREESNRALSLDMRLSQATGCAESLRSKNQRDEAYISVLEGQNHELTALVHLRDESLSAYVETVDELRSALDACESETSEALNRVDELENSKYDLVERITELEDHESELENDRDEALNEVEELEDRIEELETQRSEALDEVSGLEERVEELEDRESDLEIQRDEALDEVKELEDANQRLIDGVEAWTVKAMESHNQSRERQERITELEAVIRDYQQLDELAKAA